MERLTQTSDKGGVAFTFDLDVTCQPSEIKKILRIAEKLKEYEDLEEKLNGVSVKQVVDGFIRTAENHTNEEYERGLILTNAEADKWNEYKQLDEQGLLLRFPCKVGDTVYCIYERYTKCSENEQEFDEYSCQGCECLECDSHKELYVQSQKAYSLDWIVSNLKRFGKTVFLTQAEAEQKLKEMESD